jgi:hypothetical protein
MNKVVLFTTAPVVGCDKYMGNSTNSSCEFFTVTRSHMQVSVESIIYVSNGWRDTSLRLRKDF